MRKFIAISLAALAAGAATPALAQDTYDWGGFYGGISGSYDMLDDSSIDRVDFDRGNNGSFGEVVTTSTNLDAFSPGFCGGSPTSTAPGTGCDGDDEEFGVQGRLGFDFPVASNFIVGLVGEAGWSQLEDNVTAFSTTPASYTFTRSVEYTAAIRARAGVTAGPSLIYVTGGWLHAKMDNDFATTNGMNTFTQNDPKDWSQGYQAGAGVEYMVTQNMSLGLEYLYNDVSNGGYSVTVGQGTATAANPFVLAGGVTMRPEEKSFAWHSLRAVANFRF